MPAEWRDGIIISLHNGKGARAACSNCRPISLLSVTGKVFAQILRARLQPLLTPRRRPQQSGFTGADPRSTIDAILALRLLPELHREFVQNCVHVAYILTSNLPLIRSTVSHNGRLCMQLEFYHFLFS